MNWYRFKLWRFAFAYVGDASVRIFEGQGDRVIHTWRPLFWRLWWRS